MKYITKQNIIFAVVVIISATSLFFSYTSMKTNTQNRLAIQEIVNVLGSSTVIEPGQDGKLVINRVITQKDLEAQQ